MATKSNPRTTPPTTQPETLAYVVRSTPLLHDGVLHQPGDAVKLTADQAQRQGANVAPAPTEPEQE